MRFRVVLRYVGFVLLADAAFLLISALVSIAGSDSAAVPLLVSAGLTAGFGVVPLVFVPRPRRLSNSEGLLVVVLSWLLSCAVGALPYLLWGGEFTLANAGFESVSGFTTTGSSILSEIEALPAGLLFWRAATHWIGGMGIIVFVLSVLPSTGNVGMVLYRSEVSALAQESIRQRARGAVKVLATVYIGLTLLETLALLAAGMGLFDAVTHSFATIATGGFSPRNLSIAHFHSVAIECVVIVFMVLSGIHFGLLYSAGTGHPRALWRSTIVRYYLLMLLAAAAILTIDFHGRLYPDWPASLRYAGFQVISAGTSTGFATMDTAVMPALSRLIFIFISLQCACAGSTSGGIKADRFVILWKSIVRRVRRLEHPHAVLSVRIDDGVIKPDIVEMGVLYVAVYLGVVFLSTLALAALGVEVQEAFSGSVATMGNVGPGLGSLGSMSNFGGLPDAAKWVLCVTMLAGRLEVFSLLMLLNVRRWR